MLQSIESNIRAFVRFINTTTRPVEVHWVNFQGDHVHYKTLGPGKICTINTFCTHPWIFLCHLTGESLQVENKEVFLPEAWFKFISKAENGIVAVGRQEAKIHYPLKTLRDACLWRILFLVQTKDDIYQLEIPNILKSDLLRVSKHSTKFTENSDNDHEMSDANE